MPEFNNVTIIKKANVYFDGTCKALGFMLPGEYTFNTADKELMEIIDGDLLVLLPESSDWQVVKRGESFNVPANAKFTVKIQSPTDYCCSFIKS
jgi:uncharacterized protein YaiE (UPF0345 family)